MNSTKFLAKAHWMKGYVRANEDETRAAGKRDKILGKNVGGHGKRAAGFL